jgi:tetratricopeptide (TPR) repeat protein
MNFLKSVLMLAKVSQIPCFWNRSRFCAFATFLFFGSLLEAAGEASVDQNLKWTVRDFMLPTLAEERAVLSEQKKLWAWDALDGALQLGLLGIADRLLIELGKEPMEPAQQQRLLNVRLRVALVRGDLEQLKKIKARFLEEGLEPTPFLEGLLAYSTGDFITAQASLRRVTSLDAGEEEAAWMALLEALLAQAMEGGESGREAFSRAMEMAPNDFLREQFELIRLRQNILEGGIGPDGISALRESVRSMSGERAGFEAARLLAIALAQSGNSSASIELIGSHLAMPGIREYGLRSDFLLLLAVVSGPASARGRLALEQLITEAGDAAHLGVAFSLYSTSLLGAAQIDSFLSALDGWISQTPTHPLIDRMLLEKAILLLESGQLDTASSSALRLVEQFPGSPYRANAIRTLAQIAWRRDPPAYRTAADYLNQLRMMNEAGLQGIRVSLLMADCFFLNGDYRRAAEVYGSVVALAPPEFSDQAVYQRILAEIGAGRFEEAAAVLDSAYEIGRYDENSLWKAEWNLVDAIRKKGRLESAYTRVEQRLASSAVGAVTSSLSLRMKWLSARLNVELGRPEAALQRVEQALASMDALQLESESRAALESHLLLVGGEAAYLLNDETAAGAFFSTLRAEFPESGPNLLSYLIESRQQSGEDNLVSAQQSLIALVDRFPGSEYAPIALWEAALNAQQRGLASNFQEAITILERLISAYPEHGLVFYARLKQGDLARMLNDFPTALALYEALLAKFPSHPEIYRAQMNRADCLMAMGSADPTRYDAAAVIYEQTFLLRNAPYPIRMEAGFKWAQALQQQGEEGGKERVLWILCQKFCFDDSMQVEEGENSGNYWLSRAFLELAELQEAEAKLASAILLYETMIRLKLPGYRLASNRLRSLG